jgi:hypothetical protein
MKETVASAVAALNRVKRVSALSGFILRTLRSAAVAVMTVSIWALVRPQEELEHLALGAIAFAIALIAGLRGSRHDRRIDAPDFLLAMEMQHGKAHASPLTGLTPDAALPDDWRAHVAAFRQDLVRFELGRNLALATSLVLPLAVTSVTLPQAVPSFRLALNEVSNVVSMLSRGATLRVIQGATTEVPEKGYPLSADEPVEIELLAQNLIEVSVSGGGFGRATPIVELRKRSVTGDADAKPTPKKEKAGVDSEPASDALGTAKLPWEKTKDETPEENTEENTEQDPADAPPEGNADGDGTSEPDDDAKTAKAAGEGDEPLSNAPLPWEKTKAATTGTSSSAADAPSNGAASATTDAAAGQAEGTTVSEAKTGSGSATATSALESASPDGAAAEARPPVFQRFQMLPVRDASRAPGSNEPTRFSISFAVAEPVDLFIPQLEGDRPLARLKVRQLPIPKVTLSSATDLEDPWPDDQPLNLRIKVEAENPLQLVRLLIKSGSRVSKELVANVMAEDRTELVTDYRLVLETYVESDLAQVEIVAEAIDRAVPTPLAGYSEPLRINTASAYGRYRATLQTLRELKQQMDDALGKKTDQLPKEALEQARKAAGQSEKSPFFDGLDRVQIHRFENKVEELAAQPGFEGMLDLAQQLNDFLFEHEILDDRERDRDFFVASRSLSRLVEEEFKKRPVAIKTVTDRMKRFLDDRQQRWEKRVERLAPEQRPPQWETLRTEQPFHKSMERVQELDDRARTDPKARSEQMAELSKTVVDYRAWIEDLEAREDREREEEERQRQEGLASARNTLRELQQRQGEVSAELDRAGERTKEQLDEQWTSTRMKQNANAKETKRLESQMRALAPNAGARIEAAHEAMEATLKAGDEGNYALGESSSDLAGRLLRQAERAASQSQQKRRSRGRRRRVTGDNYYGQSVVGGDIEIKREYQVDRRYREDILDEIQDANLDEEQRALLENYLRQIIR